MSDFSPVKGRMVLYGKIVVIRRSGEDGSTFPMTGQSCVLGRANTCAIRVQLPAVSEKQCQIDVIDGTAQITNLSKTHATKLNNRPLTQSVILGHKDLISIVDRHFRFEYPYGHPLASVNTSSGHKRRSSVSKGRRSGSGDHLPLDESTKVLTPSRKPPKPIYSDDRENKSPELMSSAYKPSPRRRSSSSHRPAKILTPKIKPPAPSSVTRVPRRSTTPTSPPARRSTNLRKSLSEIKQRADRIAESPALSDDTRSAKATKRKSNSPAVAMSSKRKRVSFGANLSPELFDKRLPPGTPIRRGSAPFTHLVGNVVDAPSPRIGLLKRRSVATSKAIKEESPRVSSARKSRSPARSSPQSVRKNSPAAKGSPARNSPAAKSSPARNSPAARSTLAVKSSPAKNSSAAKSTPARNSPAVKSTPARNSPAVKSTPARNSPAAKKSPDVKGSSSVKKSVKAVRTPSGSPKRGRQVVLKSPHVPHHHMSEHEERLYSAQRKQEGAAFKRLSHSPEPSLSSPDLNLVGLVSSSASPELGSKRKTPNATPGRRLASPAAHNAKTPPNIRSKSASILSTPSPTKASLSTNTTRRQARSVMTPGHKHVVHTDTPRPKTPASSAKKGRRSVEKIVDPPMDMTKVVALRAIHGKSATPALPKKMATPRSSAKKAPVKKTWADVVKTGKRRSGVKKATTKRRVAGKVTKIKPAVKRKSLPQTPRAGRKGVAQSTGHVNSPETIVIGRKRTLVKSKTPVKESDLYDDLPPTPAPPGVMFVSPMSGEKVRRKSVASARRYTTRKSVDLRGVKSLMKSPKKVASPRLAGVRDLVKTPRPASSPRLAGVREMLRSPRAAASPQLAGVKEMMKTPQPAASPRLAGVREMMKTPQPAASPRLAGVREMMKTPQPAASPRLAGVREMMATPQPAASPRLAGVREMMKTPKAAASPKFNGVAKLINGEKVQLSADLSHLSELFTEPPIRSAKKSPGGKAAAKGRVSKRGATKAAKSARKKTNNLPARGSKRAAAESSPAAASVSPVVGRKGRAVTVKVVSPVVDVSPAKPSRSTRSRAAKPRASSSPVAAIVSQRKKRGAQICTVPPAAASPPKKLKMSVESPVVVKKSKRSSSKRATPVKRSKRGKVVALSPTPKQSVSPEIESKTRPTRGAKLVAAKGSPSNPGKRGRRGATSVKVPAPVGVEKVSEVQLEQTRKTTASASKEKTPVKSSTRANSTRLKVIIPTKIEQKTVRKRGVQSSSLKTDQEAPALRSKSDTESGKATPAKRGEKACVTKTPAKRGTKASVTKTPAKKRGTKASVTKTEKTTPVKRGKKATLPRTEKTTPVKRGKKATGPRTEITTPVKRGKKATVPKTEKTTPVKRGKKATVPKTEETTPVKRGKPGNSRVKKNAKSPLKVTGKASPARSLRRTATSTNSTANNVSGRKTRSQR